MKVLGHNINIYMNFLKSFTENTKTDNKVTLNDSISSFKFILESSRSSIICNTQF